MERRGITELRHLLLPGFCAGLTTFSAVTAQSLEPRDGGALFLGGYHALPGLFAIFYYLAFVQASQLFPQ